jgi:HEAT repeat protein
MFAKRACATFGHSFFIADRRREFHPMSSSSPRPTGYSPDDALPPVEPPSAGFILQLFIVPGVIVVVVVMIWLMFNWLAQMGNDRDAFVRALARNNEARWQAAFNLANAMRAERGSKQPRLTGDPQLAADLAGILDHEIDAGSMEKNPLALRMYLCRALGEFRVTEPLPTLIKAATTERDEREGDVRRTALEGIAVLADNVGGDDKHFTQNEALRDALLTAASDNDPRTRDVAAVAMGVIATPEFRERLGAMLEDSNPDVRYNAAVRLAHLGDVSAVPVLAEMLDPDELAGIESEKQQEMRPFKRALITVNALRATGQLAEKSPQADLTALQSAVERLLASKIEGEMRVEAQAALRQLDARGAHATP